MTELTDKELMDLAVKVYNATHYRGTFLHTFADAYCIADSENRKLLREAWIKVIEKNRLFIFSLSGMSIDSG